MSLNQAQWKAKIEKFVPSWYFEQSAGLADAVFDAIAAVLAQVQSDVDSQQDSTFILDSSAPILDLLGQERGCIRNAGESDATYAVRIQNSLLTPVGRSEMQTVIDNCLNNGTAFIFENSQVGFLDDPDTSDTPGFAYLDDYYTRWVDSTKMYNWWTVIVPIQTGGVDADIQAAIVSVIEANKALGTTYDILYRSSSDTDTDD